MSKRFTPSLRSGGAVAAALLTLAACQDAPLAPTAPSAPRTSINAVALKRDKLATIEMMGRWPALFIQNGDGSARFQVHFENVRDRVAGNYTSDELPTAPSGRSARRAGAPTRSSSPSSSRSAWTSPRSW